MAKEERGEKVMVVQDGSRKLSWNGGMGSIEWMVRNCGFRKGDEIKLLLVLHQVNNPSMYALMEASMMGHKQRVDSNSMIGLNDNLIAKESARKLEEYTNNERMLEILQLCELKKIRFKVEVHAGPSAKKVALEAATSYKPTWVILDRRTKRDRKFFLKNLSCKISRMKKNNTVAELRGKLGMEYGREEEEKELAKASPSHQFSYAEMIPGSPHPTQTSPPKKDAEETDFFETQLGWRLGNNKRPPSLCKSSSSYNIKESKSSILQVVRRKEASSGGGDSSSCPFSISDDDFKISACSICHIRRPFVGWRRDFTYAELHAATNGFSDRNFLSEGGFGSVYRGEIDGIRIAVKQHKLASSQGEKEFRSEVSVLSKVSHENLVMLLGTCREATRRLLLVYEYVCHGSLEKHLSSKDFRMELGTARRPLSWEKRMKIARGVARGLQYLHENNIIHRDMRPNNILITHDYESRLGDFGLARTQYEDSAETRVVGTLGYLAPEYAEFGKVSTKTDVYAFGVVLLQLITGLRTTDMIFEGKSLVGWARPLLKERNYPDLIDPRIADCHDFYQLFWMVDVVVKCLRKDPRKRITMTKVLEYFNYLMDGDPTGNSKDFSPAESFTPTNG
ncbi:probable serine/threonine-protein kinase PBL4 isoform X1 [Cucurbita moschata]|uniref:Probable serine/threonine-protein kinase PBL4 isoform X1 n=1 Tax=Cucurbita moschata TaxID=3662 RepID=A0A6J1GX64_CUCMO|nr:probable serine/threonine-protein kinase PBL4 isoform X1 [Cucurbita moschata]